MLYLIYVEIPKIYTKTMQDPNAIKQAKTIDKKT